MRISLLKRALSLVNVTGLLLLMIVGCNGMDSSSMSEKPVETPSNTESVEINYWTVFTGPDGAFMQKIVEAFNKENRGKVAVKMRIYAADEYYSKLIPAVASGTAPDIGIMHVNRLAQYIPKGIIVPLNDITTKLGFTENDFSSNIWNAGIVDGKRYGIPLDIHPLGLFYNVELLKEAGFSKPPENLEEFLKIAKACTRDLNYDGEPDQWGFSLTKIMNPNIFLTLLYQFGGKAISDDGNAPAYNSKEGEQALQLMSDLIYKYKVSPPDISLDNDIVLFEQNKLALYVNGPWMISAFRDLKDLNFETAPFPKLGNQKAVWADSHNLVMFKQRKVNTEKTEAASRFIVYLSENSLEWAKAGQVPARNIIRNSPVFLQMKDVVGFAKQEEYIVFPPPTANYDAICSALSTQVDNVILGFSKPQNALMSAAERAKNNVKANNE